ncbi:MAG: signal peptidase I [Actinobacteria bacterium HGW-Actinobacteria-1]|jgi:signal peptidase I|nr:MAG: signal peptidase I [Actinobacteria bacterium HGW-Actinobacteria-1]
MFLRHKRARAAGSEPREEQVASFGRWLLETVFLIVLAFTIAQAARAYAIQPYVVPTGSMIPTIEIQDRVLVEKITYRVVRSPARGEVVVFDNPHPTSALDKILIKRVIATEGQTVDIYDDAVWVDGVALDEPYVHGKPTLPGTVMTPITIPEGQVWLMGDNRTNSGDSRFFGPQPVSKVRGRAIWTYWPPKEFGELE